MVDIEYLEEERKKLWAKLVELEGLFTALKQNIDKTTPEYEKEAQSASQRTVTFKNKALKCLEEAEAQRLSLEGKVQSLSAQSDAILKAGQESAEVANILIKAKDAMAVIEQFSIEVSAKIKNADEELAKIAALEQNATEANTNAISLNKKISDIHSQAASTKDKITNLYEEITGYDYEEEGTGRQLHEEGLKEKLEKSYKKIENDTVVIKSTIDNLEQTSKEWATEFKTEKENEFNILKDKITALLPDAMTAGLCSAYQKKREDEETENEKATTQFNWAIGWLVTVSLIPFALSIYWISQGKTIEAVIMDMPRIVLAIVPLYIPVLWLAIAKNKKMNLTKRLIEEYAHKEVLAKTFEGLSTQISDLKEDEMSRNLKLKLLYNMVDVSSENPGKLITDYSKSDHPMVDVLDKSIALGQSIEKVASIPGIDAIAKKILSNQSIKQSTMEEQAKKGLDSVEEK